MWKRIGKRFGRHHDSALSHHGSSLDVGKAVYLEKHCVHGFPLSPSCLTFDAHRRVLFIGTSSGDIRMLGQPGVELCSEHDDINKVLQILPFTSEPSLITVCANNILHKWSLLEDEGTVRLVHERTYKFQGGLAKKITTCCLPPHCDCLFVGTLGGITYPIDTQFDGMSPEVLSWSRARAYLNYNGKDVPGEVRTLEINPANSRQLLIGYTHNYLELWDALTWKPVSYYGFYKEEDLGDILCSGWHSGGSQFVTAHTGGSVAFWSVDNHAQPVKIQKPFGTEPVQEMWSVVWPEEDLLVVSGGSPLSTVEAHSATIIHKDTSYTLQLTSEVRGMHVLEGIHSERDSGIVNFGDSSIEGEGLTSNKRVLILMLEQEILFIELAFPDLPLLRPPYLYSIHNSPTKCLEVHQQVSKEAWQTISQAGKVQQELVYSAKCSVWPVDGGVLEHREQDGRDVVITGHEDGTLKFWDISSVSMRLAYVLKSSHFFTSFDSDFMDAESPENESDNVKQMCFWDPRSDDDQIQVTCLSFHNEQLLVGFKGGSLLLFELNKQTSTVSIPLHKVSILRDDPRQRGRNWQAPMELRLDGVECAPGYQPSFCVGLFPNVPVTAIGFAKEQKIIGVGCMYGFTVVDCLKNTTIHVGSTFSEVSDDHGHLSRMQSIRKSFRQSLKRLNVRRSMRGGQSTQRSFRPNFVRSGSMRPSMKNRPGVTANAGASPVVSHEPTPLPPRRDSIRSITFTAPSHVGRHAVVPCVLVGTNQGGVLAYTIDMPANKHRDSRSPIIMPIEREFNARRNFAVVFCGVIDHQNYLLDINDPGSYHHSSTKGGQWIIIVTEDAVKVMALPNFKKKFRIRLKQSDSDEFHVQSGHYMRVGGQSFLVLMGSDGFLSTYTLPELKLVCKEDCVDASDAFGQRNFALTSQGLFLHLRSPSEFTRGSMTSQARMTFNFSVPSKYTSKEPAPAIQGTPKSISSSLTSPQAVTVSDSPKKTDSGSPQDEEDNLQQSLDDEVTPNLESSDDLDHSPSKSSLEDRKPLFEERAL